MMHGVFLTIVAVIYITTILVRNHFFMLLLKYGIRLNSIPASFLLH